MLELSKQGAVDLVQAKEALVGDEVEIATQMFDKLIADGQPRIVLGLENVTLIDSDGLEFLVDMQQRCTNRGGELKLLQPGQLVRDILRITKVDERFEIYKDTVNAIGSFSR